MPNFLFIVKHSSLVQHHVQEHSNFLSSLKMESEILCRQFTLWMSGLSIINIFVEMYFPVARRMALLVWSIIVYVLFPTEIT